MNGYPFIIGLVGKAGHGKDTAAQGLLGLGSRVETYAFADQLKEICMIALGLTREEVYVKKDIPLSRWPYGTPGENLQKVGTEMFRLSYPGCWIHALWAKVSREAQASDHIVVTDVRFPDEAASIRERGGYLVRVDRPGHQSGRPSNHESEMAQDSIACDRMILNTRDVAHLHKQMILVYEDLLGEWRAKKAGTWHI